jgi:hypothetical protein
MNTYLISYDLIRGRDYERLIQAIKDYPNWAKPLESLWLIKTSETVAQVRDRLINHVDADDKIFVIDVTGRAWGTYNVNNEVIDWIKNNLSDL